MTLSLRSALLPPAMAMLLLAAAVSLHASEKVGSKVQQQQAGEGLVADVRKIIAEAENAGGSVSVHAISTKTGKSIIAIDENKLFVPASIVKLFTTSAALEHLGADFQFSTGLYLDGMIKPEGEFVGTVIIRGAGDPSLSPAFGVSPADLLSRWAGVLDSLGIVSIRGNIVGDDSYFDGATLGPGWAWDDTPYPYSAQVSALSIWDNSVTVSVIGADSSCGTPMVKVSPPNSYVAVQKDQLATGADTAFSVSLVRPAYTNTLMVSGLIPPARDWNRDITIDKPALFFAHLLREQLERSGIRVRGGVYDAASWGVAINYAGMQPVAIHLSPPLADIVNVVNSESHNLGAEMISKTLGKERTGQGSFASGADALVTILSEMGLSPTSLALVDGSGLSRMNLLSPRLVTALLRTARSRPWGSAFAASLARPGQRGSLRERFKGTAAEKALSGKTGTMENTSNLAGYIDSADGDTIAYAVFINNCPLPAAVRRNIVDLICMRLAGWALGRRP